MDDHERINVICHECAKQTTIAYGRFRKYNDDYKYRCKECMILHRKAFFTPEKRKEWAERTRARMIKYWNNITIDQRKEFSEKIRIALASRSDEEKSLQIRRISESQITSWGKLSKEERMQKMKPLFDGCKEFWDSASDEKKLEIFLKLSSATKSKWGNMTEDELRILKDKLSKGQRNHWDNLSANEKFDKMRKLWDSQINIGPTEHLFNVDMMACGLIQELDYHWGYSSSPYIHPQYYDIFGKENPVTNGENFPYHNWDFIIYSRNGNDMLVDIDGSAHNKNLMNFKRGNNKYTERQKIDYNDSQRPYQIPPNMDAYVVLAYDNNLVESNKVMLLSTNEIISYKDLLIIILLSQFTEEELEDLHNQPQFQVSKDDINS